MKRIAAVLATFAALGSGVATAGQTNDDDNDYEGRVGGDEQTYFGFDLSPDGDRVKGITAYLHYNCGGSKEGSLLVETEGGLKLDGDRKFSGKTKGESKLDPIVYNVTGKLGSGGKAHGTLKAKGNLGEITCRAENDGDWNAKKGRDIDVLKPRAE
jgi:hypothetical protein